MSLLSELNTIAESCGVSVETGIFSDAAPDTYLVLTPLSDTFDLHADNQPCVDIFKDTFLHQFPDHPSDKRVSFLAFHSIENHIVKPDGIIFPADHSAEI